MTQFNEIFDSVKKSTEELLHNRQEVVALRKGDIMIKEKKCYSTMTKGKGKK